jgi:hypothetical protein
MSPTASAQAGQILCSIGLVVTRESPQPLYLSDANRVRQAGAADMRARPPWWLLIAGVWRHSGAGRQTEVRPPTARSRGLDDEPISRNARAQTLFVASQWSARSPGEAQST